MHSWHFLYILFFVAPLVHGLGVILPLRLDPDTNCAAWSSVTAALVPFLLCLSYSLHHSITAHTNTHFYIVINPDINPNSSDLQPNANYRGCIPTLRPSTNPNTIVLGYVDTATSTTVLPYIDVYAAFDTSYRPNGIILDHIPALPNDTYKNYISHVKSAGFTFTALDPAAAVDAAYFPLVDLINTYEFLYSSFNTASLSDGASTPLSKQSVVLTNAPTNDSYSAIVSQLANLGVGAVFITDRGNTDSALPSQWSAFVSEVAKLVPSGSSTISSSDAAVLSSTSNTGSLTSPSSTEPVHSHSHTKPPIGAIIGGVLGAVLLLAAAVLIFMRIRRRRNLPNTPDPAVTAELDPTLIVSAPFQEQSASGTRSSSGKGRPLVGPSSPTVAPWSPTAARLESSPSGPAASEPRVSTAHRESLAVPAYPPPSYSDVGSEA
ncbi:Spherulation-specific family 4-domain-containing protein [Mycena capillaripes]|nr:Spherulation-specific family 4-domain-containing protein [Mycena capillaripes]